jgi:hypothetical protein
LYLLIITRDNDPTPYGGFTNLIRNQPQVSQNNHLVGGPSYSGPFKPPRPFDTSPPLDETTPHSSPVDVNSEDEVVRTEKRILWTQDEDVRLVSSLIQFVFAFIIVFRWQQFNSSYNIIDELLVA